MAGKLIGKLDRLFNIVTLLLLLGSGMVLHVLTALTLKSYYGDPWGYVSFVLPVLAEAYLITIQLADDMYNYTLLFVTFLCLAAVAGAAWYVKNIIKLRIASLLEPRS